LNKTIAIAAVLMDAALIGVFSSSAYATDGGDESETNTEQEIKQKNVGSGESENNNCALNSIDSALAEVECPVGLPPMLGVVDGKLVEYDWEIDTEPTFTDYLRTQPNSFLFYFILWIIATI
jgi:hypothetical protein